MQRLPKKVTGRVVIRRRLNKNGSYGFSLEWRDQAKAGGWSRHHLFTTEEHPSTERLEKRWEPEAADRRYEMEQELYRKLHDDPTVFPAMLVDAIAVFMEEMSVKQAPSTVERLSRLLPDFTTFVKSKYRIEEAKLVHPRHVRAWRQHRLDGGRRPSTVNMEMATLSGFFQWMLAKDVPWVAMNATRMPQLYVKHRRAELTVRTPTEFWELLRRIRKDADHGRNCTSGAWRANLVLLTACTGLRVGEIRILDPPQWKRDQRILCVPDFSTGPAKRHRRDVPVGEHTQRALEYFAWLQKTRGPGALVPAIVRNCRITHQFNRFMKQYELVPHDLRRFFYTALETLNIPAYIRDDLMGHAPPKVRNAYSHVNNVEAARPAIKQLDAWLGWPDDANSILRYS